MTFSLLIVDDDEQFLEFVAGVVKVRYPGIVVQSARDGMEALAIIKKGAPPDLVLTDMHMPRLDGNALCKSLREAYRKRIKVAVMTGNGNFDRQDFDAVLAKPFPIDALYKIIDDAKRTRGKKR
nr:response regulator [Candidatus Sigynarchaeota archaeon]